MSWLGCGKRFHNPAGSPKASQNPLTWLMFFLRRLFYRKPPVVPSTHVLSHEAVQAGLLRLGNQDGLTWLGHAAFLIQLDQLHILTDPFLSDYASPVPGIGPKRFVPPGLSIEALPVIDIILVSHNHYDHLDKSTLRALQSKSTTVVICPLKLGSFFTKLGYTQVIELDWYQSVTVRGLRLMATPAIHFSNRYLLDHNRTFWCGYQIQSVKHNLYFSGDTAYHPLFDELGERAGPFDYALINIGAYCPRKIMKGSHNNPKEAIKIARHLQAKTVIGMHWGTVVLTDEPVFEPPILFRKAGLRMGYRPEALWVMKIGETREF